MQNTSVNNSGIYSIAASLVSFVIIIGILILAKSFLIPLAWSLLIGLASFRLLNKLENKYGISRMASSSVFVLFILLILFVLTYFFYREIVVIIKGIPNFSASLIASIQEILDSVAVYGIHLPTVDQSHINSWVTSNFGAIVKALAGFGKNIGEIFLIAVYLFFILYYRDNYLNYLRFKEKSYSQFVKVKEKVTEIADVISGFLYGLLAITVISVVLLYVIFLLIGLKFAMFFAVMAALLSLIPYLGNLAGIVIVVLFASVSSDGIVLPMLTLVGMIFTNALKSYVFKPFIIGHKINLNAFVIFLSVILGGLIWGVSGMILFMPFAGIVKILLEYNEKTRPLVALFVTPPKKDLVDDKDMKRES